MTRAISKAILETVRNKTLAQLTIQVGEVVTPAGDCAITEFHDELLKFINGKDIEKRVIMAALLMAVGEIEIENEENQDAARKLTFAQNAN
jgi:hypothetical protein